MESETKYSKVAELEKICQMVIEDYNYFYEGGVTHENDSSISYRRMLSAHKNVEDLSAILISIVLELQNTVIIESQPVPVNLISLKSFINQDPTVKELDSFIASLSKKDFKNQFDLVLLARLLAAAGLPTISDIDLQLGKYKQSLILYIEELYKKGWMNKEGWKGNSVKAGTSLVYLCDLVVADTGLKQHIFDYFNKQFHMDVEKIEQLLTTISEAKDRAQVSP